MQKVTSLLLLTCALAMPGQAGLKHYYERSVFVYTLHPDLPLEPFLQGRLGIPHPRHARIYHYVTYRYLTGRPLNAFEQRAVKAIWERRGPRSQERSDPLPSRMPSDGPAYQQAAKLFRSNRYAEAAQAFAKLANDRALPWRDWAAYLEGRSLLWHARSAALDRSYLPRLRLAQAAFERVVNDPSMQRMHEPAERLLTRILVITTPKAGLERLGRRLLTRNRLSLREHDLELYLNAYENHPRPEDELTLWLRAYQTGHLPSIELGWRQTGSRAWLLALLQHSKTYQAALVDAALAVPLADPGGAALHFEAARLLAQHGDFARARQVSDAIFRSLDGQPSTQNQAASLRMQLSANWEEFARWAPRRAILRGAETDQSEWPQDHHKPRPFPQFDPVAVQQIQRALPSRLWPDFLSRLPEEMRPAFARSYELRRQLLEGTADPLALLRRCGARPYPKIGVGRGKNEDAPDELRSSYWTLDEKGLGRDNDLPYWQRPQLPDLLIEGPFATAEERAEARAECLRLQRLVPNGFDFVARGILAAVQANPRRPDAPRLLLETLQASGVSWFSTVPKPDVGFAVYRLLHTSYPNSLEAATARDWFEIHFGQR